MTEKILRALRVIIGAPDYDRYIEHLGAHHPGERPLTRAEFEDQRMNDKYARPGSRCC
jgi:uncharacterized short protein YbdD (DUF466 family)